MKISLAYLAGFFDGEGSVGIYSNGKGTGHSLKIQITQNDSLYTRELFECLLSTYGGRFDSQRTLSGNLKLNFQLNGDNAYKFLAGVMPLLHFKKKQAQFALKWALTRPRLIRGAKGRYLPRPKGALAKDKRASLRMKELKRESFVKG